MLVSLTNSYANQTLQPSLCHSLMTNTSCEVGHVILTSTQVPILLTENQILNENSVFVSALPIIPKQMTLDMKIHHPRPVSEEHHTRESVSLTRLPKFDLPQFSGNPLYWKALWDCFKAAVHNNTSLTRVQKLSYLRAQLKGGASKVIAGFQLTNSNYTHSVTLLQEHFGQPHK